MKNKSYINIEIDKLTNSIENVLSGDKFDTEIIKMSAAEIKKLKKKDWFFDWQGEYKRHDRDVYRLVIENHEVVHGLISITDKGDHIFMHLIESAKFNRGKGKAYAGVPGNLVAFACKFSYEKGYGGFVAFDAKTALIKHYQDTLFATSFKGTKMFIDNFAAERLINQYFKK